VVGNRGLEGSDPTIGLPSARGSNRMPVRRRLLRQPRRPRVAARPGGVARARL